MRRQVKALLKADCKQQVVNVATVVKRHLDEGKLKEAHRCLKRWYRVAKDWSPEPCYQYMDLQTKERGVISVINVEFFYINDKTPEDVEIRAVVKGMHNGTRT